MGNIGTLTAHINADTSTLAYSGRQVSTFVNTTMGKLGILSSAFTALGAAMASIKIAKMGMEYQSALVDMGKITKQTFSVMNEQIKGMSAELGTSTELMRGYYQVISAGVTEPVAALELLTVASKTAKAAHIDQGSTVKALTKLLAGYQGQIESATEAADLLFAMEKEGQTTVMELVPVIGELANMSRMVGINSKEMAAALSLVTQTAGSTAEATTQLSALLRQTLKPTEELIEIFSEFNSLAEAMQQLGLVEFLRRFQKAAGDAQGAAAMLGGRAEALVGYSALMANNFETLAEKIENVKEQTGALENAWEKFSGSAEGLWDTIKNKINNELTNLGYTILPFVSKQLEKINDNIELILSSIITLSKIIIGGLGLIVLGKVILPLVIAGFVDLVATIQLMNVRLALAPGLVGKLTTSLTGTTLAAKVASKQLSILSIAASSIFAGFVGWEIGKWLSNNFEEARIAGVILVDKLISAWNWLKHIIKVAIESWKGWFKEWIYEAKKLFGEFLELVASGLEKMPFMGAAAAGLSKYATTYLNNLKAPTEELNKTLTELEKQYEQVKKTHKETIDSMLLDAIEYNGTIEKTKNKTEEMAKSIKKVKDIFYNEPFNLETITNIDESKVYPLTFIKSKKLMDEFLEDILDKHEKFTQDQLQAYRAMYDDMGKFSKKYYNTQRKLIEAQAKEFEKAGIKENEINQWKYEKLREIRKQELRGTEGFVGGAISYLMDLQDRWENFYTIIGQLGYKTFESLYTAFEDTIFYGIQGKMEELEDVWENTWSNIKDMFFRVIAQMIAKAAISKIILPISTSITGGAVGGSLAQMAGGMGGASLAGAGFGLGSIIDFTDPGTILSSAGFMPIHDAMVGIADQLGLYGAGAFLSEWSNVIIPGLGGLITLAMGGSPASAIGTTIGGIFGGPLGAIAGGILGQLFTGGAEYPIGTYTQSNFNTLSGVYGKSASAWQMGTGISSSGYNALVPGNFGYAGISGGENIIQAYVNARDTVIEGFNQEVLAWLDTVPDSLRSTIEGQLSAIDFSYSFEAIQKNAQNIEQDINEFIENYYNHLVEQYGQILNNIDVQRLIAYTSYMEELQAALDNILLTDEQKEIRVLNEWYKAQVDYLESLSLTTEQGLDALSRLNELYQLRVQQIADTMSSSNASAEALQEFIDAVRISSEYAPSLSYEGLQQMYEQLKQKVLAGEEGAVGQFTQYLKSDYLPFMQAYGGNYNELYQSLFGPGGELETLMGSISTSDPIVDAINNQTTELVTELQNVSNNVSNSVEEVADRSLSGTNMDWVSQIAQGINEINENTIQNNPYVGMTEEEIWNKYFEDYLSIGGSFQSGATITGRMIAEVGEKGKEYIVPSYEPERTDFLRSVGVDPYTIGQLISQNISGNGSDQVIEVNIDGDRLLDIIVKKGEGHQKYKQFHSNINSS